MEHYLTTTSHVVYFEGAFDALPLASRYIPPMANWTTALSLGGRYQAFLHSAIVTLLDNQALCVSNVLCDIADVSVMFLSLYVEEPLTTGYLILYCKSASFHKCKG